MALALSPASFGRETQACQGPRAIFGGEEGGSGDFCRVPLWGTFGGTLTSTQRVPPPGLSGIWSRWGPEFAALCLHCTVTTPTSELDCSSLSATALPGHAHAHRRWSPVSDHQPAGGRPPSTPGPGRRLGRDTGEQNTFVPQLPEVGAGLSQGGSCGTEGGLGVMEAGPTLGALETVLS